MIDDILGEWDLILGESGRGDWDGRIAFLERDGRLLVQDADPESRSTPSRVEVTGTTLRFEMLSAGSSRGNAHHTFELTPAADGTLRGTRRRGLLARTPLVGVRAAGTDAAVPSPGTSEESLLTAAVGSEALAEVRARAAAAAEHANLAAAQAAAAAAEAEAMEAIEVAPRAAVRQFGPTVQIAEIAREVPSEVLAILPAPSAAPVLAPAPRTGTAVLDDTTAAEASEAASEEEFGDPVAG